MGLRLQLDDILFPVLRSFCHRQQARYQSTTFVFREERIDELQKPAELGLRDGDVIDTVVVDIHVGNLITQLSSSSAMQQEHAAWAMGVGGIGTTNFGGDLDATADAVPQLLLLLESSSAAVQSVAVMALARISALNPVLRAAAAGAIPRIVLLLGSSSARLQYSAAGALKMMASDAVSGRSIVAAGATPLLSRLLGSDSSGTQHYAALTFSQLAAHAECQASLVADGAIPAIIQLLSSSSDAVTAPGWHTGASPYHILGNVVQSLKALHLLSSGAGRLAIMASSGAIPPLVRLVSSYYGHAEGAAQLLLLLAADNVEHHSSIVGAGAIPALVQLLASTSFNCSALAKQYAARILVVPATNTGVHVSLADTDAIPAIVGLLGSESGEAAARAVSSLLSSSSEAAVSATVSALMAAGDIGVMFAASQHHTLVRLSKSSVPLQKRAAKIILGRLERAAALQHSVTAAPDSKEAERLAVELVAEEEAEKAKAARKKCKKKAGKVKDAAIVSAAAATEGTLPGDADGISGPSASNDRASDAASTPPSVAPTSTPPAVAPTSTPPVEVAAPVEQPEPAAAAPPPAPPAAMQTRPPPAPPPSVVAPDQPAHYPALTPPAPPAVRILLPPALQHLSAMGPRPGGPLTGPGVIGCTPMAVLSPNRQAAPMVQHGATPYPIAACPIVAGPIAAGPAAPYRPALWGSSSATARRAALLGPEGAQVPLGSSSPLI